MNITLFIERLKECRKRKFTSQQAFADAYMKQYGMIRQSQKTIDHNMFGTVQSWEQGKSTPTADVLSNICDLLDCDADYLLGRIDERTHDISDSRNYTGLSAEALEQLHSYHEILKREQDWMNDRSLDFLTHQYYRSFALFLIDQLLTGSKSYKLSSAPFYTLLTMIYEEGIGINPKDYIDGSDDEPSEDTRKMLADECRERIDMEIHLITNNIRDILMENAVEEQLPKALNIDKSNGYYTFKSYD